MVMAIEIIAKRMEIIPSFVEIRVAWKGCFQK